MRAWIKHQCTEMGELCRPINYDASDIIIRPILGCKKEDDDTQTDQTFCSPSNSNNFRVTKYFVDFGWNESAVNPLKEHIQTKIIDVAKNKIFDPENTDNEIVFNPGFKCPQHFGINNYFKKLYFQNTELKNKTQKDCL